MLYQLSMSSVMNPDNGDQDYCGKLATDSSGHGVSPISLGRNGIALQLEALLARPQTRRVSPAPVVNWRETIARPASAHIGTIRRSSTRNGAVYLAERVTANIASKSRSAGHARPRREEVLRRFRSERKVGGPEHPNIARLLMAHYRRRLLFRHGSWKACHRTWCESRKASDADRLTLFATLAPP